MKLIIAIIQDEDAGEVISHLNEAKFQVTRLSTKGGFLRAGNTTIMTGVEKERVELDKRESRLEKKNRI